MPVHIGQATVDAVVAEDQPLMVDAEEMQDRGVQVVAVGPAAGALVAELVALSVADAALDAGAGQPGNKRAAVMVTAGGALRERHPAELGRPDDQRVVEQAALLQVAE